MVNAAPALSSPAGWISVSVVRQFATNTPAEAADAASPIRPARV